MPDLKGTRNFHALTRKDGGLGRIVASSGTCHGEIRRGRIRHPDPDVSESMTCPNLKGRRNFHALTREDATRLLLRRENQSSEVAFLYYVL